MSANLTAMRAREAQAAAERLEDVRWMVETGESLVGAAARLGISDKGLTKWLETHAPELHPILLVRNPRVRPAAGEMR